MDPPFVVVMCHIISAYQTCYNDFITRNVKIVKILTIRIVSIDFEY